MNAHIVGQDQFSEKNESPSPIYETSLAVVQFVELVRGERTVMRPCNPLRVEAVRFEKRYCLHCFGVRGFDVIEALPSPWPSPTWRGEAIKIKRCRVCGDGGVI
jgi:hypothetical protein